MLFWKLFQLSKRWTGSDALNAGIIQGVSSLEELPEVAQNKATELVAPMRIIEKTLVIKKRCYTAKMQL